MKLSNTSSISAKKIISDPKAAYNHQLKLQSSKQARRHLTKTHAEITRLLYAIPDQRERLREMRADGQISREDLDTRFSALAEKEEKHRKRLEEIELEMAKEALSEGTGAVLESFSRKYRAGIDVVLGDRKEAYVLLHELIEEIVVGSRPTSDEDIIAGKRKKDRMIPSRLHIKLKLPQELLHTLSTRFGVETTHLSWLVHTVRTCPY